MYKIISKSRLPLTVTIIDRAGNEIPITLPRFGTTSSQRITNSMKQQQTLGAIVVRLEEPIANSSKKELSGVVDSMIIRKFNGDQKIGPSTESSIDWDFLFKFLDQKPMDEIKTLAKSLQVSFGASIGKTTLINRLLDQRTAEIIKLSSK